MMLSAELLTNFGKRYKKFPFEEFEALQRAFSEAQNTKEHFSIYWHIELDYIEDHRIIVQFNGKDIFSNDVFTINLLFHKSSIPMLRLMLDFYKSATVKDFKAFFRDYTNYQTFETK